jgi:regulator of cell morphogenesis and NO signaling
LADIVTADVRTAAVLDRAGLDYCCHGHQTLEDAAAAKGVSAAAVLAELDTLGPAAPADRTIGLEAELDALTEHIMATHHAYVREAAPRIQGWLEKLAARHGDRHPELREIRATFDWLSRDLGAHMIKEENILFPHIDALAAASRAGGRLPASPFGTILNPIGMMEEEHRHAGDQLESLRRLTRDYTPPEDGCTTYRLCYEELARFEGDLHRHVHAENNVLFPRAIELEREFGS